MNLESTRATDLFLLLTGIRHVSRLRKVRGRYIYTVRGIGTWEVRVAAGDVRVRPSETEQDIDDFPSEPEPGADPCCMLVLEEDDFLHMVFGRRNVTTAVMQGRADFRGDSDLGLFGQHLFLAMRAAALDTAAASAAGRADEEATDEARA
jgi:hypothetical protein